MMRSLCTSAKGPGKLFVLVLVVLWIFTACACAESIDDLFLAPAQEENLELALESVCYSAYAFEPGAVEAALVQRGFENWRGYSYQETAESVQFSHYAAFSVAEKTINGPDGSYDLIAVIIRGSRDYAEWRSNLDLGGADCHNGFQIAAGQVIRQLENRISDPHRTKVWITGYGRGAAVGNITAHWCGMTLPEENVHAYLFATPNVTQFASSDPFIHNYILEEDALAQLPPGDWGYGRHGSTRVLFSDSTQFDQVAIRFEQITGQSFDPPEKNSTARLINSISALFHHNYLNEYQQFYAYLKSHMDEVMNRPLNSLGEYLSSEAAQVAVSSFMGDQKEDVLKGLARTFGMPRVYQLYQLYDWFNDTSDKLETLDHVMKLETGVADELAAQLERYVLNDSPSHAHDLTTYAIWMQTALENGKLPEENLAAALENSAYGKLLGSWSLRRGVVEITMNFYSPTQMYIRLENVENGLHVIVPFTYQPLGDQMVRCSPSSSHVKLSIFANLGPVFDTDGAGFTMPYTIDEEGCLFTGEYRLRPNGESIINWENGLDWTTTAYGGVIITGAADDLHYLDIPEMIEGRPVTHIAAHAFENHRQLIWVRIPDSVVEIGAAAFAGCTSLTDVFLPQGLTQLNESVFSQCSALTYLQLPASLQTIGANAFNLCTSLETVVVNGTLRTIGEYAFTNCHALRNIDLPSTLTTLGEGAFSGCKSLAGVTIPKRITHLDTFLFYDCQSLAEVRIPYDLESVSRTAFGGDCAPVMLVNEGSSALIIAQKLNIPTRICPAVQPPVFTEANLMLEYQPDTQSYRITGLSGNTEEVIIPETIDGIPVTQVSPQVFTYKPDLQEIVIGAGVETLSAETFADCPELTRIQLQGTQTHLEAGLTDRIPQAVLIVPENSAAATDAAALGLPYLYDTEELSVIDRYEVRLDGGKLYITGALPGPEEFVVPGELFHQPVYGIARAAFAQADWIHNLILSENLQVVEDYAFSSCANLRSVQCLHPDMLLGHGVFYNCTGLKAVSLPENLEAIPAGLFEQAGLETFVIPASVTEIGEDAFRSCPLLAQVAFEGRRLIRIGEEAFRECPSLAQIRLPYSVEVIGAYAFLHCDALKELYLPARTDLTEVSRLASENTRLIVHRNSSGHTYALNTGHPFRIVSWKELDMSAPNLFTAAENGLEITDGCLHSYVAASGWVEIGGTMEIRQVAPLAFGDNLALEAVKLAEGVERISDYAFLGCRSLAVVILPESLAYIGPDAFLYCDNVEFFAPAGSRAMAMITALGYSCRTYEEAAP